MRQIDSKHDSPAAASNGKRRDSGIFELSAAASGLAAGVVSRNRRRAPLSQHNFSAAPAAASSASVKGSFVIIHVANHGHHGDLPSLGATHADVAPFGDHGRVGVPKQDAGAVFRCGLNRLPVCSDSTGEHLTHWR